MYASHYFQVLTILVFKLPFLSLPNSFEHPASDSMAQSAPEGLAELELGSRTLREDAFEKFEVLPESD